MRLQIIFCITLALALLQGCGRKGPLTPPPVQSPAAQAQQPEPAVSQQPLAPPAQEGQAQ